MRTTSAGFFFADPIGSLNQVFKFCLTVERSYASRLMPQRVLSVREAHSRCPQAPAKRVLEIVDSNIGEPGSLPSITLSVRTHPLDRSTPV